MRLESNLVAGCKIVQLDVQEGRASLAEKGGVGRRSSVRMGRAGIMIRLSDVKLIML